MCSGVSASPEIIDQRNTARCRVKTGESGLITGLMTVMSTPQNFVCVIVGVKYSQSTINTCKSHINIAIGVAEKVDVR